MDPAELLALERRVQQRLDGRPVELAVVGAGETSVVVGWPAERPRWACKRLPPSSDGRALRRHGDLVRRYEQAVEERGIAVSRSAFHLVPTRDRTTVLCVVQPLHPAGRLLPAVLRARSPQDGVPAAVHRVVAAIGVVDDGLGLDAQLSNWAVAGDRVELIDTTTPFLRDGSGRTELSLDLLLTGHPAATRALVRRFVAPGILARYHRPRAVALDLVANLHREGLSEWIDPIAALVGDRFGPPLVRREVDGHYRADARTWAAVDRLRAGQRWWTRRVRRRTYPVLLPEGVVR